MIQLVIFDFDDTITDNSLFDYQSFVFTCKKLNLQIPKKNKIIKLRKKGFTAKEIIKMLKLYDKKTSMDEFIEIRSKFLDMEKFQCKIKLKNKTKYLLYFLLRKKIRCILCSAKINKQFVINFLKKENIHKYFQKTYFMKDLNILLDNLDESNRILIKNIILKKILKDEKLLSSEIIYIGNSNEDYQAAKNKNLKYIHYQNSYLKKLEEKNVIKVNNMYKIVKIIEKEIKIGNEKREN
jgi:phosphoglycolate phosphatase-like HAD superfamily hydrolase